jgi:hypothetical protein
MKNVLNAVTAICIILFLGWQFCGDCCGKKCDKSDKKECDYSKCKSSKTKKECPHANKEETIITNKKDTTEKVNTTQEDETIEEYNKRIADQPGNGTIYIRDGDTTFFEDMYMIEPAVKKFVKNELAISVVSRAEKTISDDGKVTYVIVEEEEEDE